MSTGSNPKGAGSTGYKGVYQALPLAWQDRFIEAYRECLSMARAAVIAGVSRPTVYKYLAQDADFAEKFRLAKEDAIDDLQESAFARAKNGSQEVRNYYDKQGNIVGQNLVTKHETNLTIKMLESHRPEIYAPIKKLEHSGPNGGPIQIDQVTEKKRLLTLAVQNGLNAGMSLEETLSYLSMRGVPAEALALVSGDDLIFPNISISQTDISTANTNGNGYNGNGHGYIDIEGKGEE